VCGGVGGGGGSVRLRFDVTSLDNRFPTFRMDVLPPSSGVYISFFTELYSLEYAITMFCRNIRNCLFSNLPTCPRIIGPSSAPDWTSQNSLTGPVIIYRCDWLSVRKRAYVAHKFVMKQSARTAIMCRKFVVERLSPVARAEAKSLCTQIDRRVPAGVTYWLINKTDTNKDKDSSSAMWCLNYDGHYVESRWISSALIVLIARWKQLIRQDKD
jgi:hypothetical protein